MNTYCHTGQNNMYYPSHPLTNNAQIPVQRYLVHKTMSDLAPDRFGQFLSRLLDLVLIPLELT